MNKLKLLLVEKSDQLEKLKKEEEVERVRMKEEVKGQAEAVSKLKREREISKGAWVSKEKKYQVSVSGCGCCVVVVCCRLGGCVFVLLKCVSAGFCVCCCVCVLSI